MRRRSLRRYLNRAIACSVACAALAAACSDPTEPEPTAEPRIAFVMIGDVFTARTDGSDLRRITTDQLEQRTPAWSPDGRSLMFVSDNSHPQYYHDLYRLQGDDAAPTLLTPPGAADVDPAWSPDGSTIAVTSWRGSEDGTVLEGPSIFLIDADGKNRRRLTNGTDTDPSWAPNSRRVVFVRTPDPFQFPTRSRLYIVDVTGAGETAITDVNAGSCVEEECSDSNPDWSPDGQHIAFSRMRRAPEPERFRFGVWLVRPDGSDLHQVAENAVQPSWSPDGTEIVFVTAFEGRIEFISADGAGRRPFQIPFQGTEPDWESVQFDSGIPSSSRVAP